MSTYANEGRLAHAVAETWVVHGEKNALGLFPIGTEIRLSEGSHNPAGPSSASRWISCPASLSFDSPAEPESFANVTEEMHTHGAAYASYVRSLGSEVQVEKKLAGNAFFGGTVDALVFDRPVRHLHIVDYKYGRGVPVSAKDNLQLMCYAVLALWNMRREKIESVGLHIYQPRVENGISSTVVSFSEVIEFASITLLPALARAEQALTLRKFPDDFFNPSEAACRWCPGKAKCPALKASLDQVMAESTKLIEKYEALPLMKLWMEAVEKAMFEAVERGEFAGQYSLMPGRRGPRKWIDEKRAAGELLKWLGPDEIYSRQLKSPTELEKLVVAKEIVLDIDDLISQTPGRLSIVKFDPAKMFEVLE